MTLNHSTQTLDVRQDSFRWHANDTASAYAAFVDPLDPPSSQRQDAKDHGIPRSTLGSWLRNPPLPSRPCPCRLLFQHGQTRIDQKRLSALTVVHNYLIRRSDGTTAAERFFAQQQHDLFEWLLLRMTRLPTPAQTTQ